MSPSPSPPFTPEYAAENSSQPLLNVCISFAILETFFVIAFIFSWHFNRTANKNSKAVYWLILVGYLFCFSSIVLGILKITIAGAGYHANTLHPNTIQTMLKIIKAQEFVYIFSILLPKLAILTLYHRLFTARFLRYVISLTAFLVIATFLFGFTASFANCRPFASFWNRKLHAKCTMDIMTAFRYYSIPNIVTDVLVLVVPLSAIRKLQVGTMTKIGVYLTFLTMAFGIVTAVLRFVSFLEVQLFADLTYYCVSTTSWTIIEPGVYFIAATMPTLRPLIRRICKEANEHCPITRAITSCARDSFNSTASTTLAEPPRAFVLKKKSTRSLQIDVSETIGQRPSRAVRLDDYHYMQNPGNLSPRSMDEESMVCADAALHETMGKQGRNPDGTLRGWSLQPVKLSPMRTSFFFAGK